MPLQGFLERLKKLHDLRLAEIKKPDAVIIFDDVSNDGLYTEAVAAIWQKLVSLKEKFPDKFKSCELFFNLEEIGVKKFSEKFAQLFIDRRAYLDVPNPQYQYNRVRIEKEDKALGSDLCYAEGFAVGFLFMLTQLERQFSSATEFGKKEFFNLLRDFNAIAIVGDKINSNLVLSGISMRSGGLATMEGASKTCANFKEMGEQAHCFFFLRGSESITTFSSAFKHSRVTLAYYDRFEEECAKPDADRQKVIYDLAHACSYNVHNFFDGNGRSAMLMGCYLSLLNGQMLPNAISPLMLDDRIFSEAANWTKEWALKPSTPSMSLPSHILLLEVIFEASKNHILEKFLESMLECGERKEVIFCLGDDFASAATVFLGSHEDRIALSTAASADESAVIDIATLRSVIAANEAAISAEPYFDKRNFMILLAMGAAYRAKSQEGKILLAPPEFNMIVHMTKYEFAIMQSPEALQRFAEVMERSFSVLSANPKMPNADSSVVHGPQGGERQ